MVCLDSVDSSTAGRPTTSMVLAPSASLFNWIRGSATGWSSGWEDERQAEHETRIAAAITAILAMKITLGQGRGFEVQGPCLRLHQQQRLRRVQQVELPDAFHRRDRFKRHTGGI